MTRFYLTTMALLVLITGSIAQTADSVLSFTLEEAQQYAIQNNPVIRNANLDLESAKKKVWETTAIGLPQVYAKYSYAYTVELNDQIKDLALGFGPKDSVTGAPLTKEEDLRVTTGFDITASQLIFSGAYIVGLQTSKVFKSLTEYQLSKSNKDLREAVDNAYFTVLVMKENKQITDSSYQNLLKLFDEMKAMQKQGFVEETDIDQLEILVSNLKNTSDMLTRQVKLMENLLKFQMGLPIETTIVLKDNLSLQLARSEQTNYLQPFTVEALPDYKLIDAQAQMMKLNLKLQQSAYLPDVAAFYQYHKNLNDKSFEFTPPQMVGVSVSWNIFTSGQRIAKVSQARMGYQKAVNTREQVADGLMIEYENAKSIFITAKDQYETNKRNLSLAKKIYDHTLIKYKQGVSSNTELTQVQNQYYTALGTYYSTLTELINADNKLRKLIEN